MVSLGSETFQDVRTATAKKRKKRRKETAGAQGISHAPASIEHQLCATSCRSHFSENRRGPCCMDGQEQLTKQSKNSPFRWWCKSSDDDEPARSGEGWGAGLL